MRENRTVDAVAVKREFQVIKDDDNVCLFSLNSPNRKF